MKQLTRAAWVAVIIGLVSFGLTFRVQAGSDVLDKPWLDHVPHRDKEPFRIVIFSSQDDDDGNPAGGFIRADSFYKMCFERFSHQIDDKEIRYLFLHDNVKAVTRYKIERIPPDKDDLDWKLTLDKDPRNNQRQSVFYSSSQWQSHPPAFIRQALPSFK